MSLQSAAAAPVKAGSGPVRPLPWCSWTVAALLGPSALSATSTMGWSVGEALLIPFLLHHGISAELASLVWVVNPVVGLFVNAVLEAMSVVGLLVVAWSPQLSGGASGALLAVVLAGYGVADLAHDVMAAPARSLVLAKAAAIAPRGTGAAAEDKANALVSVAADAGRLLGLALLALPWAQWPAVAAAGWSHLQVCTVAVLAANALLVALAVGTGAARCTCARVKAPPAGGVCAAVAAECAPLVRLPPAARWVLGVTTLGWLLLNLLSFYWTAWVASAVFNALGGGEAAYTAALRWGAAGMALTAAGSGVWGLALPSVNAVLGTRRVFLAGVAVGAGVCVATATAPAQTLGGSLALAAAAGLLPAVLGVNAFVLLTAALRGTALEGAVATAAGLLTTCMVVSQLAASGAAVGLLALAKHALHLPCTWHMPGRLAWPSPAALDACHGHTSVAFLLAAVGGGVALALGGAVACAPRLRPAPHPTAASAPLLRPPTPASP